MTIKVTLNPGHHMNYHSHERRLESWNIIEGTGRVVIDGKFRDVGPGDVIMICAGEKHILYVLFTVI